MDFGVDSTLVDELVTSLKGAADQLEAEIELIYQAIGEMQEDWDGESYAKFYERCSSYRTSLDTLVAVIRAYGKLLENQVEGKVEELENVIYSNLSS